MFPPICILPQIRPLEDNEKVLRAEYVRKCIDTHLSSRHFRNQIRYLYKHFDFFRDLFQQTWDGIRVSEFIAPDARHEDELSLLLMDDGFVAEAANFGHGLQMWLQITWFLARTSNESVIILDEPDVYMHPEQQLKMVPLLRDRFKQCLLSTHSQQIIEACETFELLRLHRSLDVSRHGVSQSDYDQELEKNHKPDLNTTPKEVVKVVFKIVLFGDSKISIWDPNGQLVKSIKCTQEEESHILNLDSGQYRVSLIYPQDIELYVDGQCRSFLEDSDQPWADFVLDLTNED